MSRFGTLLLVALGVASCGESAVQTSLDVVVRTDLIPGREFVMATVSVLADGQEEHVGTLGAQRDDDFLGGQPVGEFPHIEVGDYDVVVTLNDGAGVIASQRTIPLRIEGRTQIVVTLTRRCAGVACPSGACQAGACVPPDCLFDCGPSECTNDEDCGLASACTRVLCTRDGQCMVTPDDSLCGPEEVCTPERGCRWADPNRCHPSDCDDGNPCTQEHCGPTGCENVPIDAPCDDGLFCNGADRCGGGTCSIHEEPPCPVVCNEATRSCQPCTQPSDCGAEVMQDWSECEYSGACVDSGERTRSVMRPMCDAGRCSTLEVIERQPCNRETDGEPCGDTSSPTGEWSECAGFESECDHTGTQTREVMGEFCVSGECQVRMGDEMQECERPSREHMMCGEASHFRCCGGECRNTSSDNSHCGGCGLACSSGLDCRAFEHDGATRGSCAGCTANTQCPPSAATCWIRSGVGRCQCQSDSHCGTGQSCYDSTGDNYCYYSGPI